MSLIPCTSTGESEYPLQSCSHRWVENEVVAKKAQVIWPKVVEIIDYWKGLPKGKQPGGGEVCNKITLLVPVKLHLFEEVPKQLNSFLVCFQTDAPRVSFLENIIRKLCAKCILTDVFRKAKSTRPSKIRFH